MDILVCVKRVPDTAENEIQIKSDGSDIERDDLVYSVNEWDNYAVEEAIQIRDKVGGTVTVVTVGDEEAEEVLRREMAMGADNGILDADDIFEGSDGRGIAAVLKAEIEKGKYDLVMTGALADDGAGQVGGMLAAMLDWPYASVVNMIEVQAATRKSVKFRCPVCFPFKPASTNRAMWAYAVSARWLRWKSRCIRAPIWGLLSIWSVPPAPRLNGWITSHPKWVPVPRFWKAAWKKRSTSSLRC
jgi:hypothetical protein